MKTDILVNYIKILEDTIDAEGVYPMPSNLEHEDGGLTLVSFATSAETMLGATQNRWKEAYKTLLVDMAAWIQ